jgi:hypothetical protein
MEKREAQVMVRSVLGLRTVEQLTNIGPLDALKAGLWEFMAAVGFVTDAQARAVLARVEPALKDVLPVYEKGGTVLPVFHVTFAEQRWMACPLQPEWYDMELDETSPHLPEPAVLMVTCDVTAMYLRQKAWLKKLKPESKDARHQHHAAGSGEK